MSGLPVHVVVVGMPVFGGTQQGMAALLVHHGMQEFKAQKGEVQACYCDQTQGPPQQRHVDHEGC